MLLPMPPPSTTNSGSTIAATRAHHEREPVGLRLHGRERDLVAARAAVEDALGRSVAASSRVACAVRTTASADAASSSIPRRFASGRGRPSPSRAEREVAHLAGRAVRAAVELAVDDRRPCRCRCRPPRRRSVRASRPLP